jgi:hypothetical protein
VDYTNASEILGLIQEIDAQIVAIDIQLKQYTDSKYTTSTSVSSAKLQDEIQAFYNKYQQVLINESQNRLKNEFLKKCFGLIVIIEQTDYYIAYQQYLNLLSSVETIKYKKGYVTKNKLDTVKLDISKNDNMLVSSLNQYDNARDYIDNETNISKNVTLQLKMDMKEIKKATLLDLNQANVDKESAEIAYYKSCYEVILWENILDYCIYGGTV